MPTYTNTPDQSPRVTVQAEKGEKESLIQPISAVPIENAKSYAADLAFMEEIVEVMISPSHDSADTTRLVEVSVNGKTQYFIRGEWTKCKRYFLERLLRAKNESWRFAYKHASDGATVQTEYASQFFRYPVNIRDMNPKGQAWAQSITEARV